METLRHPITDNLTYLVDHLTGIRSVLVQLVEKKVITIDERERILLPHNTTSDANSQLFFLLIRKDWKLVQDRVLSVLRITNNNHCVDTIQGVSAAAVTLDGGIKILGEKWWPDKKQLTNSFYERKSGDDLMIELLFKALKNNDNKTTVINQKLTIPGMGGVGKTTLAKWFGHHYESNYDYIVWIDCGEQSFVSSFASLARELNIADRNELTVIETAKECFKKLAKCKCLFIFDNAERFSGENGIKDVLPTNNTNFYCLITSRNAQWGQATGHGKIQSFPLDVFKERESVEFFQKNLKVRSETSELEILSNLLGHLPLALQVAVAALNNDGMHSVSDYINLVQDPQDVICSHVSVDDYEKTINKTMKISLDMIRRNENGQLAYEILQILGFVPPDGIEFEFLTSATKKRPEKIKLALLLLEMQSLIKRTFYSEPTSFEEKLKSERERLCTFALTPGWPLSFVSPEDLAKDGFFYLQKTDTVQCIFCELVLNGWKEGDQPRSEHIKYRETCPFLHFDAGNIPIADEDRLLPPDKIPASISIHRLVQQVIRFNEKESEKDILLCILRCEGFLHNKLLAYEYAWEHQHKSLQEEFKHSKAELIDQTNLEEIFRLARLGDVLNLRQALIIAKDIQVVMSDCGTENQKISSKHNLAYTLYKCGLYTESMEQFKNIFKEMEEDHRQKCKIGNSPTNIKELNGTISRNEIALRCLELRELSGELEEVTMKEYIQQLHHLHSLNISVLDALIDLSLFPHTIENIIFFQVGIKEVVDEQQSQFSFKKMKFEVITGGFNINSILSKCKSLEKWEWWEQGRPTFLLDVYQIPKTVKSTKVTLGCINLSTSCDQIHILQNFIINVLDFTLVEHADDLRLAVELFKAEQLVICFTHTYTESKLLTAFSQILDSAVSNHGRVVFNDSFLFWSSDGKSQLDISRFGVRNTREYGKCYSIENSVATEITFEEYTNYCEI